MELKIRTSIHLRDRNAKNKTSLVIYITSDKGLREKVSTGISIKPSEWIHEKQKSTNKAVNDKLNEFQEYY
jgi:hypothetical protein